MMTCRCDTSTTEREHRQSITTSLLYVCLVFYKLHCLLHVSAIGKSISGNYKHTKRNNLNKTIKMIL